MPSPPRPIFPHRYYVLVNGKVVVDKNQHTDTMNRLDLYLSERVKELTQGRQTPTTTKPPSTPDFPVALVP